MPRAAVSPAPTPRGAGMPAAASAGTAAGTITATIAILKADLEKHQREAVEIKALIAKLETYATASTAPSATPSGKRRGGRPPIDPADAQRAKESRQHARIGTA